MGEIRKEKFPPDFTLIILKLTIKKYIITKVMPKNPKNIAQTVICWYCRKERICNKN